MLYFIVNYASASGKCREVLDRVRKRLAEKNIGYKMFRTKYEGHATELAKKLSGLPEKTVPIVVIGGDGTINEVINGITDFEKVRLAVIPAGSGNDFAGGIGLDKDTDILLDKLIANCEADRTRRVDIGRVSFGGTSRLFGISSGVGMDAIVCKKVGGSKLKGFLNKLHLGQLSYLFMTVYTLFSMETSDIEICFGEKKKTVRDVIFFVGMNLRAEGGGVPMAPDARSDDGVLSFSSAAGIPKWRTFLCLPFLVAAKQKYMKGFDIFTSENAVMTADKPMTLHADGEYLGEYDKIGYECLSGRLKVFN